MDEPVPSAERPAKQKNACGKVSNSDVTQQWHFLEYCGIGNKDNRIHYHDTDTEGIGKKTQKDPRKEQHNGISPCGFPADSTGRYRAIRTIDCIDISIEKIIDGITCGGNECNNCKKVHVLRNERSGCNQVGNDGCETSDD